MSLENVLATGRRLVPWTRVRRSLVLIAALAVLPRSTFGQGPAEDPGVIIKRYVDAIGGEPAIRRQHARHTVAELQLPAMNVDGRLETWALAPNQLLTRSTVPGFGTTVMGFDGTVGWSSSDVSGAVLLSGKQLDQLRTSADFYLPLHSAATSMRMVPARDVEGRMANVVIVTWASGGESTELFDVASGLLVAMEQHIASAGGEVPTRTVLRDYRAASGVLLPMTIEQQLPGGQRVIARITQVDTAGVDSTRFALPAAIRTLRGEQGKP